MAAAAALPPRMFATDHQPLPSTISTEERVTKNIAYFDGFLSLIPARIYFGPEEDAGQAVLSKYAKVGCLDSGISVVNGLHRGRSFGVHAKVGILTEIRELQKFSRTST